jgi:hypothetical protein
MRFPRASAVIVALSTFVAVVTVATLVSQIAPSDRAGAVLPDGPIVTTGQPVDESSPDASTPAAEGDAPEPAGNTGDNGSTGGSTTVVAPAPAESVAPEPTAPDSGPPVSPGNSSNAPGLDGSPGNSGDTPGQGKP